MLGATQVNGHKNITLNFESMAFFLGGYQCAPPGVNLPDGYQHGQYCQFFGKNHVDCFGESKHSLIFQEC